MSRFDRRRDVNEGGIVSALRGVGASVFRLNDTGLPDLLVGIRGETFLLEVKQPLGVRGGLPAHRESSGGRGDLTAAQVAWREQWKGAAPAIVRTPEEALAAIAMNGRRP